MPIHNIEYVICGAGQLLTLGFNFGVDAVYFLLGDTLKSTSVCAFDDEGEQWIF